MSPAPPSPAPSSPPPRGARAPIERFLGPEEASGGPFAVLGLAPRACDEHTVLAALDRQLDRVARHIECDTPEADEVRLALHAAAAQLLDPGVRRHLLARWARGAPSARAPTHPSPPPSATLTPVPPAPARARSQAEVLLEQDAVLTLGVFGGWNARSLRRLVTLAHARGLTSSQVAAALRTLASRRRGSRPPPSSPVPAGSVRPPSIVGRPPPPRPIASGRPLPEQIDPAARLVRRAIVFGGLGLVAVAAAIMVLVRLLTSPPGAAPPVNPAPTPVAPAPESAATEPGPTRGPDGASPARASPPPRAAPGARGPLDTAALTRELAACVDGLGVDPEAAAGRFERAVSELSQRWGVASRDRLVAAHDAIVEYLYRAGDSEETAGRALTAIGAGAAALRPGAGVETAGVWPGVWSVGMLVRLAREKDLPIGVRDDVDARIAGAVGHDHPVLDRTFEAGAAAALGALPRAMIPSPGPDGSTPSPVPESWTRWADAAQALFIADDGARDRVLLSGLQSVLLLAPDPGVDRGVLTVVELLTTRVSWRDGADARRSLLRWFDDRRVSMDDLRAVTAALATRSGAEGVDLTMVLSPVASDHVRADLRDRYAKLWGVTLTVDRGLLAQQWAQAARSAVDRSYAATGEAEHLASAVVLARLSESAGRLWRGDTEEAARLLDSASVDADAALQRNEGVRGLGDAGAGDGAWAERYLAARRNSLARQDLLDRLSSRGVAMGPVDAEVLISEALSGTPVEVRARAADAARAYVDSPTVVSALLEQLPRAPRVVQTAQLVQAFVGRRLPMVRDPAFPAAARRALVERLLELTAPEGELATIDRLSWLLAGSYRGQASEPVLPAAARDALEQPPAQVSAAVVRRRWRDGVSKISPVQRAPGTPALDQLDRAHAARLGVARGLVQEFAAEQVAIVHLMGVVVGSELPARAEAVRVTLAELLEKRRTARHVLEQVNAAERAIVQLWLVRLPEGES